MDPMIPIAELPGGIRLPYVERGDPLGVPVVFLHGVTDSWRAFEPVLAHLPAGIRAIAVTQRGHGEATRPESGYGIGDLAGDVAAFFDALGIDAAVVVGHSMGTAVAQRFAAEHPQRVRALMLIGAFHSLAGNEGVHEIWSTVSQLQDPVDPQFVRDFQAGTSFQPLAPEFLDMVVGESLKLPARVWRALFEGFLHDRGPRFEQWSAPTAILWGEQENICMRADQDQLLERFPDARFVAVPQVGHSVHWEKPELVARELAALVART
ncbi:MAG TPA: alpha/beta fold hydrolase [Candidatus Binatia bacterium]|nr:alpha/beta fold hydrolase [Candidatus Binatia bacterium]